MKLLKDFNAPIPLPKTGAAPQAVHLFEEKSAWAVNAALAAKRPLLLRGEPGVGKTQLAKATATLLNAPLLSFTVDARTESRDLLWHFDAVQRLADAQLLGAIEKDIDVAHEKLKVERYLHPGPVWWAFNWQDAAEQAEALGEVQPTVPNGWEAGGGCVLLIDEIDKAESDVPNGLLEALGTGSFTPHGRRTPVVMTGEAPLVIITTNEERMLPDAFIRRCLVMHLQLPESEAELQNLLVARAAAHFPSVNRVILDEAAEMLIKDRQTARNLQVTPLPGQAEYLDLVRAVSEIGQETGNDSLEEQKEVLKRIRSFVLDKNAGSRS